MSREGLGEGTRDVEGHPQSLCWQAPWLASVSSNRCTKLFVISWNFSVMLLLCLMVKMTLCSTTMLPGLWRRGQSGGLEGTDEETSSHPTPSPGFLLPEAEDLRAFVAGDVPVDLLDLQSQRVA